MILPAITQTVTRYCLQYMKIAGITGKKDRVGGGFLPPPKVSVCSIPVPTSVN